MQLVSKLPLLWHSMRGPGIATTASRHSHLGTFCVRWDGSCECNWLYKTKARQRKSAGELRTMQLISKLPLLWHPMRGPGIATTTSRRSHLRTFCVRCDCSCECIWLYRLRLGGGLAAELRTMQLVKKLPLLWHPMTGPGIATTASRRSHLGPFCMRCDSSCESI